MAIFTKKNLSMQNEIFGNKNKCRLPVVDHIHEGKTEVKSNFEHYTLSITI